MHHQGRATRAGVGEEAASAHDGEYPDAGVGGRGSLVMADLAREGGFATVGSWVGPSKGGMSLAHAGAGTAHRGRGSACGSVSHEVTRRRKERRKNESLSS